MTDLALVQAPNLARQRHWLPIGPGPTRQCQPIR